MSVVIEINESHPQFTGLDSKHIALIIGAVSHSPMFYNFTRNTSGVGAAGSNNKILSVSKNHPLVFENEDFALLVTKDLLSSARTVSPLIDYMRKNLITVSKDNVVQTPAQIINFTP